MRRYAKANRALTAFETDITRYKELQHDIQSEEGISNLGFIRIDCAAAQAGARAALPHVAEQVHAAAQQQRRDGALRDVRPHGRGRRLFSQRPANLDQLAEQIQAARGGAGVLREDGGALRAARDAVPAAREVRGAGQGGGARQARRAARRVGRVQAMLHEVQVRLQKAKADFKDDLLQSLNDFNNQVTGAAQRLPAQRALRPPSRPIGRARELIAEYTRARRGDAHRGDRDGGGLEIFAIEPPANKETAQTEKDLELLDDLWTMLEEWNANMDEWKFGKFKDMDVNAIENGRGRSSQKRITSSRRRSRSKLKALEGARPRSRSASTASRS